MANVTPAVVQAQNDIVELHENSENTMTFAVHTAQISQLNKQIGTLYGHCATIMGYVPSEGVHEDQKVARELVGHIRNKLGTLKVKLGRILGAMHSQQMAQINIAAIVWQICTDPNYKRLPEVMLRQMGTAAEALESIQKDFGKTLADVQELAEVGQDLGGQEGKMQSLDRVINEALSKVGGGSESVRRSLDRVEQAKKVHAESRAGCEKSGQELAQLMGKQAHEACKHAVFDSIANNAKTDAVSLNAAAEESRRRSVEACQAAADAADKRWHTKQACSSSVTTENTADQAKARADKFRALALQSTGDCSNAEEKVKKAAVELGGVKAKMVEYERKIDHVSKQFVEQEKDCSTKCRQLRELEKEILDLEQKHRMSLSCIADFRAAMQVLPEKFSSNGQKEQYVLQYWEGTLKESINTSKFFMTSLVAAQDSLMPISDINLVLIPILRKMKRDADSNAARTQALHDAIRTADERSPLAGPQALQDAIIRTADGRSPTGPDMVHVPDPDEPLF